MEIIELITKNNIYLSIITIVIAFIIYYMSKKMIIKLASKKTISNKRKTIIKLLNNILKYILIILSLIIILEINGINVTSIVAGLGVITLVAGLALQDALKDIIMGLNLIVDDYFSVGDIIVINDTTGKVLELGMKATKIEDLENGGILTIANRNILQATVLSNWADIDIPLPYEENITKIEEIINIIITKAKKLKLIDNIEYKGLSKFDDSAINYKIRIYSKPDIIIQSKRDVNRLIKEILDENNISIPYTQIRLK